MSLSNVDITIRRLVNSKHEISSLKVLKGYFLIVGGGKFGKIALDYALSMKGSLIIVLDKRPFKELFTETIYDEIKLIEDFNQYNAIIKNYKLAQSTKSKGYFLQTDNDDDISRFFNSVIPEFIIPVIPSHYFARLFLNFVHKSIIGKDLEHPNSNSYSDFIEYLNEFNTFVGNETPSEIKGSAHNESKFLNILKAFPEEVILQSDTRIGVILLSYARIEEICPNNCIGPVTYCPTFKRNKPTTIKQLIDRQIEYNKNNECNGICVESKQLKPGLGGIQGSKLQKGILALFDGIIDQLQNRINDLNYCIIGTACNCHGVINIFKINILVDYFLKRIL